MSHQILTEKTPYLYYFCDLKNLSSILEYGILSRNKVLDSNLKDDQGDWSNKNVQINRSKTTIKLSNGKEVNAHDLVPTFFTPYNTTIYKAQENLSLMGGDYKMNFVIIAINIRRIFEKKDDLAFAFSNRNIGARSDNVNVFNDLNDIQNLDWKIINEPYKEFENHYDSTFKEWAQKKSAEFLIENKIEPLFFDEVLCAGPIKETIKQITNIRVEIVENLAVYKANN